MKKKRRNKITKEELHKLELGSVRKDQVEAGFFDGRFSPRVERDKSKYSRKQKHKRKDNDSI